MKVSHITPFCTLCTTPNRWFIICKLADLLFVTWATNGWLYTAKKYGISCMMQNVLGHNYGMSCVQDLCRNNAGYATFSCTTGYVTVMWHVMCTGSVQKSYRKCDICQVGISCTFPVHNSNQEIHYSLQFTVLELVELRKLEQVAATAATCIPSCCCILLQLVPFN